MHDAPRTSSATARPPSRRTRKALALERRAAAIRSGVSGVRGSSRWLVAGLVVALSATTYAIANTVNSPVQAAATDCWDEYTLTGNTIQRVVTPTGVTVGACTVPTVCLDGWNNSGSTRNRLYVPHGRPKSSCTTTPPTTTTTTTTTTTVAATTTTSAADHHDRRTHHDGGTDHDHDAAADHDDCPTHDDHAATNRCVRRDVRRW